MASLIQWTWIWGNCRWQWKRGKPSVLQFMRSQKVRCDFVTEQQPNDHQALRTYYLLIVSSVSSFTTHCQYLRRSSQNFSWSIIILNPASLVARTVKNLPAMQEIWVRSLGQEDPLGRRAWRAVVQGSTRVGHDWATNRHNLCFKVTPSYRQNNLIPISDLTLLNKTHQKHATPL